MTPAPGSLRYLPPLDAAACLVSWLERRGAVFELRADETFRCHLDRADVTTADEAEAIAGLVLALRAEIRALLCGRQTIH